MWCESPRRGLAAHLPTEDLPDRFGVFVNGFIGQADEDRNSDEQQQDHHYPRAADADTAPGTFDGVHVWPVGVIAIGMIVVFHRWPVHLPIGNEFWTTSTSRSNVKNDLFVRGYGG
jgi:hypothetical protein